MAPGRQHEDAGPETSGQKTRQSTQKAASSATTAPRKASTSTWHGGQGREEEDQTKQTPHSNRLDRAARAEGRSHARHDEPSGHGWHGSAESDEQATLAELAEGVDLVFSALADPTRRQVLQALTQGRPLSASALAAELPVSRQAVAQHLLVLQQAGLVESRRAGREVLFSVCPEGLIRTASWMTTLAATWSERLEMLKRMAESPGRKETS